MIETFKNDDFLSFPSRGLGSRDAVFMQSLLQLIRENFVTKGSPGILLEYRNGLVTLSGNGFRRSTLLVQRSQGLSAEFYIIVKHSVACFKQVLPVEAPRGGDARLPECRL